MLKVLVVELVDSMTGVQDTIGKATEKVKEFAKEVSDDAKSAAKIADQRAKAIYKLTRNLIIERAEAERKVSRFKRKTQQIKKF